MERFEALVIPDVHGRDFWRLPTNMTLSETEAKVIFLGDYTDPYPKEFEHGFDYKAKAMSTLSEIIELKKKYPERITLLLGNHDCTYRFGRDICECRTDNANYDEIRRLFTSNKELFRIAHEETIGKRHLIFSHAGIHRGYAEQAFPKDNVTEENVVEILNGAYDREDEGFIHTLGMYDRYRGYGGYMYGSPVWADLHSWHFGHDGYGYQIVGHTQLNHGCGGYISDDIADLDSAEAFTVDSEGKIATFKK